MGVKEDTEEKTVLAGIAALKNFFKEMGAPVTLEELHVGNLVPKELAEMAVRIPKTLGNFKKLHAEDIEKIFALMH